MRQGICFLIRGQMTSHPLGIEKRRAAGVLVENLWGDRGPAALLIIGPTCGTNLVARVIVKRLHLTRALVQGGSRKRISYGGSRLLWEIRHRFDQRRRLFNGALRHRAMLAKLRLRCPQTGARSTNLPASANLNTRNRSG